MPFCRSIMMGFAALVIAVSLAAPATRAFAKVPSDDDVAVSPFDDPANATLVDAILAEIASGSLRTSSAVAASAEPAPTPTPRVVRAGGPAPKVTIAPVELSIPRIGVDARVQPVDLAEDGAMGAPSGPWTVGWWDRGFLPGQPGSAVMDGHVDYRNVGPAVFWNLGKLRPGDEIRVTMPGDRIVTFVVERTVVYAADTAVPLDLIFAPSDVPRLNLITCTGTFNPSSRTYDRRLVVFSRRAPS